jgi:hypothetical protein
LGTPPFEDGNGDVTYQANRNSPPRQRRGKAKRSVMKSYLTEVVGTLTADLREDGNDLSP